MARDSSSQFQEKDIEFVLDRFQEEFDNSLIRQRFALNTTSATVEESLQEFVQKVDPYITQQDRLRMERRQAQGG